MSARAILFDCDPGIDDAVALLLALASPEEIELLGVTTVAGNKPLPQTTANARRVLDLLPRPDIAVSPGCAHPLLDRAAPDRDFHGQDGLGDIGLPPPSQAPDSRHAVDFIIETVMQRPPRSVTLCAVAPLTNVALALAREPLLAERLDALHIMGGALWDEPRPPEFNFHCDPQAAQMVLTSGARIALLGLNMSLSAPIAGEVRVGLAASPVERLLSASEARSKSLHDAYVVARLIAPELFEAQRKTIEVEWRDRETGGSCREANHGAAIEVVTRIDTTALTRLFVERLGRLAAGSAS